MLAVWLSEEQCSFPAHLGSCLFCTLLLAFYILTWTMYLWRTLHKILYVILWYDPLFRKCIMFSGVRLFAAPWTVACQVPLSMEFFRHEYLSGLPFPPPGDLPNPGIQPRPPALALQVDSLPSEPSGKPIWMHVYIYIYVHMYKHTHTHTYMCPIFYCTWGNTSGWTQRQQQLHLLSIQRPGAP